MVAKHSTYGKDGLRAYTCNEVAEMLTSAITDCYVAPYVTKEMNKLGDFLRELSCNMHHLLDEQGETTIGHVCDDDEVGTGTVRFVHKRRWVMDFFGGVADRLDENVSRLYEYDGYDARREYDTYADDEGATNNELFEVQVPGSPAFVTEGRIKQHKLYLNNPNDAPAFKGDAELESEKSPESSYAINSIHSLNYSKSALGVRRKDWMCVTVVGRGGPRTVLVKRTRCALGTC